MSEEFKSPQDEIEDLKKRYIKCLVLGIENIKHAYTSDFVLYLVLGVIMWEVVITSLVEWYLWPKWILIVVCGFFGFKLCRKAVRLRKHLHHLRIYSRSIDRIMMGIAMGTITQTQLEALNDQANAAVERFNQERP